MPQSSTKKKTLLVDFDGVLHDYHGWTGELPIGPPIAKARAAMHRLETTYRLVCFTTRPTAPTESWLRHYGFPPMKVTNVKEPAHVIIDDRAITFLGVWSDELITQITSFRPHWESAESDSPSHASLPEQKPPSELP